MPAAEVLLVLSRRLIFLALACYPLQLLILITITYIFTFLLDIMFYRDSMFKFVQKPSLGPALLSDKPLNK
jgi:hypothetical protein